MEIELVRKSALAVKALGKVVDEKDFTNFLPAARDLSDNIIKLVQIITEKDMIDCATGLRDSVKNTMSAAKIVMKDKTEDSLIQLRLLLKEVVNSLVRVKTELDNYLFETVLIFFYYYAI